MTDTPPRIDDLDDAPLGAEDEVVQDPDTTDTRTSRTGRTLWLALLIVAVVVVGVMVVIDGTNTPDGTTSAGGTAETTEPVGAAMAGPEVDVQVSAEALANEPAAPDLSTPEAAVRSYVEWTSYAYRTAQSQAALPTMTMNQEVRVDSYVQYNIQRQRLLDQSIKDLAIGSVTADGTTATVTVREVWEYSYVSISEPDRVVSGPHTATYNAVYSLVKDDAGGWVVDSVDATAEGEVK